MRRVLGTFLLIILIIFSSAPLSTREWTSGSGIASGSFQLSFQNLNGNSKYTISYSYPTSASWNDNLNVAITVFVNELTGVKEYVQDYSLILTISANNGGAIVQRLHHGSAGVPADYLYQGSHWGPINMTVPLNPSNFSASSQESLGASLSIQFIGNVQYGLSTAAPPFLALDSGTGSAGNITITVPSEGISSSEFPQILAITLICGGVAVVGVLYYLRGRKKVLSIN